MARMIWRLHWDQRSDWVDLVDRHAATRRVFWIRHREDRRRLLSAAVAVVEAGP
jgi:hypothetical protein